MEACGKAEQTWASGDRMRSPPTPTSRYLGEGECPEAPARDERLPAGLRLYRGASGGGGRGWALFSAPPTHTHRGAS